MPVAIVSSTSVDMEELEAPLPEMPPFDESNYAPLPEIDWDKVKP